MLIEIDTIVSNNTCDTFTGGQVRDGLAAGDGHLNLTYPATTTCPGIIADPHLGTLHDNGGPTPTMAITPPSPAIDRIPPLASAGYTPIDQRGIPARSQQADNATSAPMNTSTDQTGAQGRHGGFARSRVSRQRPAARPRDARDTTQAHTPDCTGKANLRAATRATPAHRPGHRVGRERPSAGAYLLTVSVRTGAAKSHSGLSVRSSGPARTPVRRRYFWARRPEIAGDVVYRVPRCLTPCQPVSPVRPRRTAPEPPLVTFPVTQKALSWLGKGLDLRKLVAGAGFEPATSGL